MIDLFWREACVCAAWGCRTRQGGLFVCSCPTCQNLQYFKRVRDLVPVSPITHIETYAATNCEEAVCRVEWMIFTVVRLDASNLHTQHTHQKHFKLYPLCSARFASPNRQALSHLAATCIHVPFTLRDVQKRHQDRFSELIDTCEVQIQFCRAVWCGR